MRATAFVLIVIVIVMIAFGGIAWLGYSFPTQRQTQQEQSETDRPASPKTVLRAGFVRLVTFIREFREEIVAVGTVFIALFTVILAFATAFLYFATRDLVEGAEDTAKRQLRAYVFLDQMTIADPMGTPKISIRIKNYGSTPAYGVVFWSEGVLREYPLTSPLIRSRAEDSPVSDIGPTGALLTAVPWDGPIQEADKAALVARSKD